MEIELDNQLNKVKETVEIPIYSNIKLVNGRIIAKVEGSIETPVKWLKEGMKGR